MDNITSQRIDKVYTAINNLPSTPKNHIYWIVYNKDMIQYTKDMFISIKGKDYFDKYVTIVAKNDDTKARSCGTVYFDPGLMDLLSNGYS